MGMEGFKSPESQEKLAKNRVLELAEGAALDNQISQASKVGVEKRIEILKTKKQIFETFLLRSLKEEFDVDNARDIDFSNQEFKEYVNRVSKERLVKMLEVKKMQFEENLQDPKISDEVRTYDANYIDAVDELIQEMER